MSNGPKLKGSQQKRKNVVPAEDNPGQIPSKKLKGKGKEEPKQKEKPKKIPPKKKKQKANHNLAENVKKNQTNAKIHYSLMK